MVHVSFEAISQIKTWSKKAIVIGILWSLLSWKASNPDVWNTPIPFDSRIGMTLFSNPLIGLITLPTMVSFLIVVFPFSILSTLDFLEINFIPYFLIGKVFGITTVISTSVLLTVSFSFIFKSHWNEIKLRKKWVALGAAWGATSLFTFHFSVLSPRWDFYDWMEESNFVVKLPMFMLAMPFTISSLLVTPFMLLVESLGLGVELIDAGPEGRYFSPILWFVYVLSVVVGSVMGFFASKIIGKLRAGL